MMAVMAVAVVLTACSSNEMACEGGEATVSETKISQANDGTFEVYTPQTNWPLTGEQLGQVGRVNDFGLRIMRLVQENGKSLVFSPLSLGYALGMTGLGCDGVALKELNEALGLEADDRTTLHDIYASLMEYLPKVDKEVSLHLANAFFMNSGRDDVEINPAFKQALTDGYDAGCETLDFADPEALNYINNWAARQTKGFIPNVVNQLMEYDIAMLLNALYFKADWTFPFDSEYTEEGDFRCEEGEVTKVPFMHLGEAMNVKYGENELYRAVTLPYAGRKFGMTVLLPREGKTVNEVLQTLSSEQLSKLAKGMKTKEVYVTMPRYDTRTTTNLIEPLTQAGLPSWFDDACLLRGLVQEHDGRPHGVYVSNAFQVGHIKVNEKGTEAAAVTVISYSDKGGGGDTVSFVANHPFVYLITEEETGVVLFVDTYYGEPLGSGDTTGVRPVYM